MTTWGLLARWVLVLGYWFPTNENQSNRWKKKNTAPRINIIACFIILPPKKSSAYVCI